MNARWSRHTPTPLDRENALVTRLCALSDDRLATITVDELVNATGCDARVCEVKLLARRAAVERVKRGENPW